MIVDSYRCHSDGSGPRSLPARWRASRSDPCRV